MFHNYMEEVNEKLLASNLYRPVIFLAKASILFTALGGDYNKDSAHGKVVDPTSL